MRLLRLLSQEPRPRRVSPRAGRALFDQVARRHLHMSGDAFIRAWDAGAFSADPDRPDIMRVAMLIDLGRRRREPDMPRVLRRLALLALALALLLGVSAVAWPHVRFTHAAWGNALCVCPACVVTEGFIEGSWGEYC